MNLLMVAPLLDSRGNIRYFIGAQIDVSGLVKDCTDLDAFRRMLDQQEGREPQPEQKDEFQELSQMFNHTELSTVRLHGGGMHREQVVEQDDASAMNHKPRVLIQDQSTFDVDRAEQVSPKPEGRLSGPYKHVSQTVIFLGNNLLKSIAVSPHPSSAFAENPLHITLPPRPRHPTIAVS